MYTTRELQMLHETFHDPTTDKIEALGVHLYDLKYKTYSRMEFCVPNPRALRQCVVVRVKVMFQIAADFVVHGLIPNLKLFKESAAWFFQKVVFPEVGFFRKALHQ